MLGGTLSGSPPRAWGQLFTVRIDGLDRRFTPTRVGTTRLRTCSRSRLSVHPHARGDNYEHWTRGDRAGGSPPRAWGQHGIRQRRSAVIRFTPTRVGTTPARHSNAPATTVHPHARGDNLVSPRAHPSPFGSPPRAWGQRLKGKWERRHRRFTPTRVGTTYAREVQDGRIPVHPHARGDNATCRAVVSARSGSPPRAWGQPRQPPLLLRPTRFTPTPVGTTRPPKSTMGRSSVHPHARGDNLRCPSGPRH